VLYRLDADNSYHALYFFNFDQVPGTLGGVPSTGLTLSGNYVYGGTFVGGPAGGGTLFRFPVSPSATAVTGAITDFTANSATFVGSLITNGYGGEYWFTYGISGQATASTAHQVFGGPSDDVNPSLAISALKGHRTYDVHLNATVGVGSDTINADGGLMSFTTPNGAPILGDDTILGDEGGTFIGDVLDNDVEPDDDAMSIVNVTPGTNGTTAIVTIDGRQQIQYTPGDGFTGSDTFQYTVTDDYAPDPKTSIATVTVLGSERTVGAYAGLLIEEPAGSGIPKDAAAIPTPDQIAAGFAAFAIGNGRHFTARFEANGHKPVAVKGTMAANRGTTFGGRDFDGSFRPVLGGTEARITINGRTLVMRAGQAFAAQGIVRPKSDFTMRISPDQVADPVVSAGIPAGSGYAVVRQSTKARGTLVGTLPDGTPFSKSSVIDGDGVMPFLALLYKGKTGSLDGRIVIADTDAGEIDAAVGTTTRWKKGPALKDKRFPSGFSVTMTPYGGKYNVPKAGIPPFDLGSSKLVATFDRGGLFAPLVTNLTFTGSKPVIDTATDTAHAKPKFSARTGFVTGTFKPATKAVKFKGVVVQRDSSVAGFFLGTGDTGSVDMAIVP
jgi:uncharacterized repeat protein (TIGR03803 family)